MDFNKLETEELIEVYKKIKDLLSFIEKEAKKEESEI